MKEKTLKDVHAGIRDLYNRAVEFERKENWEFAATLMKEVVVRVPAFIEARGKLREYERQYTRNLKGLDLFTAKIKGLLAAPKIRKLIASSPLDALARCEEVLVLNLNNPPILSLLAEAGVKAGAINIAVEAMQLLHDYQPENIAVLRKLAGYYREDGQAQESLKVYQFLASKKPRDKRIQEELREAANFATQQKAAWEKASLATKGKSVKDDALTIQLAEGTLRDADHAKKLIALYSKELESNNSDELRKKLAEAYIVTGNYDKAIETLELVAKNMPALDPTLDKQIERAYLAKYKLIIDELRKKVKNDPSLQDNLTEAEQFILEFRIERAENRSHAYPGEAPLHFDLGAIYMEAQRYDDAVSELLEASRSPQRRTQSMALLGSCEYLRGNYESALHHCDEALSEMVRMDRHKFEVMYTRAEVLEQLGKTDEALTAFKEIYRNNARFKDVSARIKALGGEVE